MKTSIKTLAIASLMGFALSAQANTATTTTTDSSMNSATGTMGTSPNESATGTMGTGARGTSNTSTTSTGNSPSVLDQSSGTTQDVAVTRSIREELGKNSGLSTSAKNVEVITLNNTVTLRGTVASQSERTQLVQSAQRAAGNRQINNELTVLSATR